MAIKVLVVDDEAAAIDVLKYYIDMTPTLSLLATFTDSRQAIQYCMLHDVDLLLCDIEMPLMNGLEVAEKQLGKTAVIFTTAHTNYAVKAFELNIVDYLVKPISYERFLQAISKYKEQFPTSVDDHFFVKTGTKGHLERINIADIIHVEGARNYVTIYHGTTQTITLLNLKDLEQRLPARDFLRIQKSSIVAIKHISGTKGGSVLLTNGNLVVIGPTYKEQVAKVINSKLIN
ncbi:LytTR family two component transcriptional regulator [Chitinophaga skermanii]|uniref:LytTR family two component transcriptional regulator n=1 Tax=Chitinophaga skermanii TaxID=331697 RepID=A0A327QP89_9BACT|nr:LytTR family DNA-binding domain-containing protein [Chitinophaga skermanii]RAJ05524.1 LytTR family two component transcriptional regulator [Chitinophaga skermanii]